MLPDGHLVDACVSWGALRSGAVGAHRSRAPRRCRVPPTSVGSCLPRPGKILAPYSLDDHNNPGETLDCSETLDVSVDYTMTTPRPLCGDGEPDSGEECDDGNRTNGDGCSAECRVEW